MMEGGRSEAGDDFVLHGDGIPDDDDEEELSLSKSLQTFTSTTETSTSLCPTHLALGLTCCATGGTDADDKIDESSPWFFSF